MAQKNTHRILTCFNVAASGGIVEEKRVRHGYQPIVLVKTASSSTGVAGVKQAVVDEDVCVMGLANGCADKYEDQATGFCKFLRAYGGERDGKGGWRGKPDIGCLPVIETCQTSRLNR